MVDAAMPVNFEDLAGDGPTVENDPVLLALEQAESDYRSRHAIDAGHVRDLEATRQRLASAETTAVNLDHELRATSERAERERRERERHQQRAEKLAEHLKSIHRALFHGDLYVHLLESCLALTGATRGCYLEVGDSGSLLAVRAAIDLDERPSGQPSTFVAAVARQVLATSEPILGNTSTEIPGVPRSDAGHAAFQSFAVVPVVLHAQFTGLILVADKSGGDFTEEDVADLLSVGDQASVAIRNVHLHRELQNSYLGTIGALANAVEAKDAYTHGHCEQVAAFAHSIADRLGLNWRERAVAYYGGLLHDIGKIGVSDGILNKPGALVTEEWDLMRAHARMGHDLLAGVPAFAEVADVVLHHHEWYDGTGYPADQAGEEIALMARIVAVADAYSAMLNRRSYKDSCPEERARAELTRCAGTQFDPRVVDAFLAALDDPNAPTESANAIFLPFAVEG